MSKNKNRRAGIIYVKVNGGLVEAKGAFTYGLGSHKREHIAGADGIHGFKETPQVAFIEGATTDSADLDLKTLREADAETVTLELNNGKVITLSDAWFAADDTANTEEGEIPVRWESSHPAVES
jgi:predicted heme/steroid binding protein